MNHRSEKTGAELNGASRMMNNDKWENSKKSMRGIKIRNFNFIMAVMTCIIYVMLLFLTVTIYQNHDNLEEATEQVRLYAETGEPKYMQAYFAEVNETRSRDLALEELMQRNVADSLEDELTQALYWSNALMEIECYAMRLTAEAYQTNAADLPGEVSKVILTEKDARLSRDQMEQKGRTLVFDDTYKRHKDRIYAHLDTLVEEILTQTQGAITEEDMKLSDSLGKQRIMITVLFILNLIMFGFIIMLVIRPLQIYIGNIQNDTLIDIVGAYEFKYLALTYNNIYEINAENKKNLRYNAEHDDLTGVLNRSSFETITGYLRKSRIPMALLIVDVDRFKTVNDTYGHEVGDAVLKKVAGLLQQDTRSGDKVIRYGGDEFIVILTEITAEGSGVIDRKIAEMNKILLNPSDGLPAVSLSVGIAFSETGYDETLFKKADAALYRIKNQGRCGCGFADDVMPERQRN